MLPSPKIVVVDDEQEDVQAIVKGLNGLGTTAVGVHFTADNLLPSFPCLRLLFLDLHLMSGDTNQQIRQTVDILANILTSDHGPYGIILWSKHVDELEQFHAVLFERFVPQGLPVPLSIEALHKGDFLTGLEHRKINDVEAFEQAILDRIQQTPQLAALLGWEEHVSRAADDAIRQLLQISKSSGASSPSAEVNRLLGELAVASAGSANARQDVFRAANEVLVSVLLDRLIHRSAEDETHTLWQRAVTDLEGHSTLSSEASARLNRFLHVETGMQLGRAKPWERGSVLDLSARPDEFQPLWGAKPEAIWKEDLELPSSESIRWLMVQVQAPCDQAQQREGLLPYILGLSFSPPSKRKLSKISKKKHVWLSPSLDIDGQIRHLAFHFRFVTGLARAATEGFEVWLRLREQILAELTHELHSYANRPGIIRFPR